MVAFPAEGVLADQEFKGLISIDYIMVGDPSKLYFSSLSSFAQTKKCLSQDHHLVHHLFRPKYLILTLSVAKTMYFEIDFGKEVNTYDFYICTLDNQ